MPLFGDPATITKFIGYLLNKIYGTFVTPVFPFESKIPVGLVHIIARSNLPPGEIGPKMIASSLGVTVPLVGTTEE